MNDGGPIAEHIPNATKSVLTMKPEHYDRAVGTSGGSVIIVTRDGQRHFGAVTEIEELKKAYTGQKVE